MKNEFNIANKYEEYFKGYFNYDADSTRKQYEFLSTSSIRLKDYAFQYIDKEITFKSDSYKRSVWLSLRYLLEYFGNDIELSAINYQKINFFFVELRKDVKLGCKIYYRNIKAFFNKAVKNGYIEKSPITENFYKDVISEQPEFVKADDLNKILEQVKEETIKDVIFFAFGTGARLNEILNLKWRNINIEEQTIAIGDKEFKTKTKRNRIIPISESILKLLNKYMPNVTTEDDFIFKNRKGNKFRTDYISKKFKIAVRKSKIKKDYHFHCLRHGFGSNAIKHGVPISDVQKWMGHTSLTTTQKYINSDIESMQSEKNKIEEFLSNIK
jgi:integrase